MQVFKGMRLLKGKLGVQGNMLNPFIHTNKQGKGTILNKTMLHAEGEEALFIQTPFPSPTLLCVLGVVNRRCRSYVFTRKMA